ETPDLAARSSWVMRKVATRALIALATAAQSPSLPALAAAVSATGLSVEPASPFWRTSALIGVDWRVLTQLQLESAIVGGRWPSRRWTVVSRPKLRHGRPGSTGSDRPRVFYSVAEVADLFGMSDMTLYRAINQGQFPAVRVRGRLFVPAKAIEAMVESAVGTDAVVDAAAWITTGGT